MDEVARDLACYALVMWANLVAILIDALDSTNAPRVMAHDILDRLDDANFATLPEPGYDLASGFVQMIRERLPAND